MVGHIMLSQLDLLVKLSVSARRIMYLSVIKSVEKKYLASLIIIKNCTKKDMGLDVAACSRKFAYVDAHACSKAAVNTLHTPPV